MKILLPQPRGFCAGVEMALRCLELALERFDAPLYVFHQIVHNTYVVERYTRRGVVFVNDIADVPEGAPVLFSAHGVSPQVRAVAEQRRLTPVDATCPLVTKVHGEAKRHARKGYQVVIIGHRGHDEVVGISGEVDDEAHVVQSIAEVEALDLDVSRPAMFVTQTTLSIEDVTPIAAALRERYPDIRGPAKDDICYATHNRQEAVRQIAPLAELVLVIGSANSSNSRRLAEVAAGAGLPAHRIDGPHDIDPAWLDGVDSVLITSGASVPESLVSDTLAWFRQRYDIDIEHHTLVEEDVHFHLPSGLRAVVDRARVDAAEAGDCADLLADPVPQPDLVSRPK